MLNTFNQRRWNIFTTVTLITAVIWIWLTAVPPGIATQGAIPAPRQGFLAPDFSIQSLQGEEYTLSDLRGNPVLLNIWATWCPPCRAEMPAMQRIYEQYADQGFVILAVNLTQQDSLSAVQQFVEEYTLSFPILLDVDGYVADLYKADVLPISYFIGKDGIIREVVYGGPMAEALLHTRVENLINESSN